MEFEEMKKIWDTQKEEYLFTINQSALHNRVVAKQKQSLHITNTSEWLMIIVNILVPVYILSTMLSAGSRNISMMIMSGWMILTASFIINGRYKRISGSARFDRNLNSDLQFAIDVSKYQVRLATLGRWNILPIGLLSITGLLEADKPLWIAAVLVIFLLGANYAAGWESSIYQSRLHELEGLKNKLEEER
jgi:hypothetical protein